MNIRELVDAALKEDLPSGDITTDSLLPKQPHGIAQLVAKEDVILSGSDLFCSTMKHLSKDVAINWKFSDGDMVYKNQVICVIQGDLKKILQSERVALNFLGHLSGIATYTRCFVEKVKHTKCKILDTRKTTPLLREWEKKAVRDGGGQNHRMNLSESIMIKENHIYLTGSIEKCVDQIRKQTSSPIEVECANLEDVVSAVKLNIHRILLDNMSNDELAQCLEKIPSSFQTEASGNMNLDRVQSVAELGVDFISIGALTHSAPNADFSLLFEK